MHLQAWLRYLRSDSPRVSAFMLAVSFMLAAIQRFEQPITDALKVGGRPIPMWLVVGWCVVGWLVGE
jgi:hypothetical protein